MDNKKLPDYLIIDFDSTFIKVEALDKLAEIALRDNPQKNQISKKVQQITAKGMNGEIPFDVSLQERLKLFNPTRKDIQKLIFYLKKNVTPSMIRNKAFFSRYKDRIFIISGGFKDYISPIFKNFGVKEDHILANDFIYDKTGGITGFNKKNLLSKEGGKIKQIEKLKLKGRIYVIGDGFSDYQIKKAGLADKFFVFCENVKREKIAKNADYILPNFDEFLYMLDLPRAYSFPKSRIKVLLLENIDKSAADLFLNQGFQVESLKEALSEEELIKKLDGVRILGIRSRTKITKKVVESAKNLLGIGVYGIGVNNVDLKSCSQKGIAVFNAPYSNTRSVAELTIGNIIMLHRRAFEKSKKMHQGLWDKDSKGCYEVRGKKLGIIGYGHIGSQVSILAEGLGMEVFYYNRSEKMPFGNAKKCLSLSELLKISDIISIHVSGDSQNANLISAKELSLMKRGSFLINISRGFVVDAEALAKNIKSGKIAGAALDVFLHEPKSNRDQFRNPLVGLSNVILTPHIGAATEEAQENIALFVTKEIINFLDLGATQLSVNLPEINVSPIQNAHRFVHIHKNVPGVLAKINRILADNNINVKAQFLKTNDDLGYVVTDVNKDHSGKVGSELREIEETIRLRILY